MEPLNRTLTIFVAILAVSTAHSQVIATFIGNDGVWANPLNWSTGQIPDANTDVLINGKTVEVDAGYTVQLEDILITSLGSVETKAGAIWRVRNETIDNGILIHRSTDATSGSSLLGDLLVSNCTNGCGIKFNPTPKNKRIVVLQSSAQVFFGLGGTLSASATQMGSGTYATLRAEDVTLGGVLNLESYYGFNPTAGQQFQIITATNSMIGRFNNLNEGDIAGTLGGVDLRISYAGNSGRSVVLTAVPEPMSMAVLALGLAGVVKGRRAQRNR